MSKKRLSRWEIMRQANKLESMLAGFDQVDRIEIIGLAMYNMNQSEENPTTYHTCACSDWDITVKYKE